ncbi:MAG: mannose-1-phosphate guanylyltransferase [Candidatus Phosphoribacter sp.]|nr:NTP transferase domain-containing protein [Actinomycetales bacterium]
MSDPIAGFWAVIPAGGAGTRLWPLSRRSEPKFLHDLTGTGRTLLQATWDRLTPLAADRVVVVTGRAHADAVAGQLPDLEAACLLAEPSGRDSMPAIAWAAAVISARDPEAIIGSFAADHVIADSASFEMAVREAVALAETGRVVTIGITPTYAATGFGYIREGDALGVDGAPSGRAVLEFVEKPDAERAAAYLASGGFRWNAGMFVVKAALLLELVDRWQPAVAAGARALAQQPADLESIWPTLTRIAIDHAVAEPAAAASLMAVVPATFDWQDVGDFDALAGMLAGNLRSGVEAHPEAPRTPIVLGDPSIVLAQDATGLVVAASGRLVAVVGVEDLVVVDTRDALLVVPRAQAQLVKGLVDRLADEGREELL